MSDNNPINLEKTGPLPSATLEWPLLVVTSALASLAILERWSMEGFIGGWLMAGVLLFILMKDIKRYRPRYLKKRRMLILLGLMVVGTLALARGTEFVLFNLARGLQLTPLEITLYGVPLAAGAMLVTLLFDFHTAIMFSFLVSLLAGLWHADAALAIYSFVGSLAASFSIIRCKKRTAILRSGFYVLTVNLLTTGILLLFNKQLFTPQALYALGFAAVSAALVTAVVSVTLPLLEMLFKVTTNISLIELLDLDHPLMRNLMIQAPGTYHHSIILGTLVESCAEKVGANPLLVRVGAYYHDIGKAKMPEYFIENQTTGVNKHEKLHPHMSSLILTAHVKEGVEMAQEHKLPEEVIDFIQQHHGSSLIKYFYEKARTQLGQDELSEDEYKYPGPKPQTRDTALLMMADAVEAASRVITDPSRVPVMVDKIITHIFLAGQLDECDLTLKDIQTIKEHFIRVLTGILHKRIDYPGFDFGKKPGEDKDDDSHGSRPPKDDKGWHPGERAAHAPSPAAFGAHAR